MKLLIVSHTPHHIQNGHLVGWGSTVREIDQLARLFDTVIHLAVLHSGSAPQSSVEYMAKNVEFLPVKPAGGDSWKAKSGILFAYPQYWHKLRGAVAQLDNTDCIHVRCPANLSLLAIGYLALTRKPKYRWVKYAGNWQPANYQPFSYDFQRWWLKHNFHHGTVSVNGKWLNQEPHVYSFINPSYTQQEMLVSRACVVSKKLQSNIKILCIGRVEDEKGTGRVIEIAHFLQVNGLEFRLDIVGDGPKRSEFQTEVNHLKLAENILFHGWLNKEDLNALYKQAHFLLLPTSASEGWPKVLSEGMAYGVVPLAGAVSSIPQILNDFHTGKALDPSASSSFAQAIQDYIADPERWKVESLAGLQAAEQFTYDHYLQQVKEMFLNSWGINLP